MRQFQNFPLSTSFAVHLNAYQNSFTFASGQLIKLSLEWVDQVSITISFQNSITPYTETVKQLDKSINQSRRCGYCPTKHSDIRNEHFLWLTKKPSKLYIRLRLDKEQWRKAIVYQQQKMIFQNSLHRFQKIWAKWKCML